MNAAIWGMATAIEVEPRGARAEASKTPASRRNVRFSGNGGYPNYGAIASIKDSKASAAQVIVSRKNDSEPKVLES
jgi:hypothetical protein